MDNQGVFELTQAFWAELRWVDSGFGQVLEGEQGRNTNPGENAKIKKRKGMRSQAQGRGRHGMSGWTLVEILIIIAILGVLAAIVIPNLPRLLGQ